MSFRLGWCAVDRDAAHVLRFRVERTEYAEIEVDVAGLFAEWREAQPTDPEELTERLTEILWEIGVRDLMYSGDFVQVRDTDTDEDIRLEAEVARPQNEIPIV